MHQIFQNSYVCPGHLAQAVQTQNQFEYIFQLEKIEHADLKTLRPDWTAGGIRVTCLPTDSRTQAHTKVVQCSKLSVLE